MFEPHNGRPQLDLDVSVIEPRLLPEEQLSASLVWLHLRRITEYYSAFSQRLFSFTLALGNFSIIPGFFVVLSSAALHNTWAF